MHLLDLEQTTKKVKRIVFDDIIGHGHIKRLFSMALRSHEPTDQALIGPPASANTMFLMSLREDLKDSYFIDGGNTIKAGIIDYFFKNRAPYLLIDEIDKMSLRDQTFLLDLVETRKQNTERPRKSAELLLTRYGIRLGI